MKNIFISLLFLVTSFLSATSQQNEGWIVSPTRGVYHKFRTGTSYLEVKIDLALLNTSVLTAQMYKGGVMVRSSSLTSTAAGSFLLFTGGSLFSEGSYDLKVYNTSDPSEFDWVHDIYLTLEAVEENSITSWAFDENGDVIGESHSFYDQSGKLLQSKAKNISEDVWMTSQPLYDKFDRAAGTTLPAPSGDLFFEYSEDFIENTSSTPYSVDNFDKPVSDPLGAQSGTLGRYYSNLNALEPHVAADSRPFTRTEYYDDGSGEVKSQTMPGDEFYENSRKTYSKTFPVLEDLDGHYAKVYDLLLDKTGTSFKFAAIKTVSRDLGGKEIIRYSDEGGSSLVSAYGYVAGGVAFPIDYVSTSLTGFEGSVFDFHIPQSVSGSTSMNVTKSGGGGPPTILSVTNLLTGLGVWVSAKPKGFYRALDADRIEGSYNYYDASFNFYDDMGRLKASVSPLGVKDILSKDVSSITLAYAENIPYTTYYNYDFQSRLTSMSEPDAGETNYIYRKDGSIRFSQNAKQLAEGGKFSYTNYDKLGRPVESGEYVGSRSFTASFSDILETTTDEHAGGGLINDHTDRKDWVRTYYDLKDQIPGSTLDFNEANAVLRSYRGEQSITATQSVTLLPGFTFEAIGSETFIAKTGAPANVPFPTLNLPPEGQEFVHGAVSYTENENTKTWYSYDERGRVKWMATWYKEIFDQPKIIKYTYDFLGNVLTVSYQPGVSNEEFYHRYTYDADKRLSKVYASASSSLLTSPSSSALKATYEYYLHGPLKKVTLGDELEDIEYYYTINGWLKSINNPAASDNKAFAQTFSYFSDDYSRSRAGLPSIDPATDLYNGNIAAVKYRSKDAGGTTTIQEMHYNYDDKYQLVSAQQSPTNNSFKVDNLVYDAHGNIQSIRRKGESPTNNLHDLAYNYVPDKLNRLESVDDAVTGSTYATYTYNEIGEMETLKRQSDAIQTLDYDVTGKVKSMINASRQIAYEYDDRGFRIRKTDSQVASNAGEVFVRDASGSIMAVYQIDNSGNQTVLEQPVYGASRLGTHYTTTGDMHYELKDHLGNVRAVVKDAGTTSSVTEQYIYDFEDGVGLESQSDMATITTSFPRSGSYSWDNPEGEYGRLEFEIEAGQTVSVALWSMTRSGSELNSTLRFSADRSSWTTFLSSVENTAADNTWQKLTHPDYIASQNGWIRLQVDSDENTSYVDDISISISGDAKDADVVRSDNYYPFGLKMNIGTTTKYRYGYQGEFAEEDEETGFNHFELRDYDPVIGRWMRMDPMRQHVSPYLAMGNNPISGVDPDGGWFIFKGGTSEQRRAVRQELRFLRRSDAQFRKNYNKARFSIFKHEVNLVDDKSGLAGSQRNMLEFFSGVEGNVKVTGNAAVIGRGISGRGTTMFLPVDYILNNSSAPAYFSNQGFANTLVHEFKHVFDHNDGSMASKLNKSVMQGGYLTPLREADAVIYQQGVMRNVNRHTGFDFQMRNRYKNPANYPY